jgi:hypothetical protein
VRFDATPLSQRPRRLLALDPSLLTFGAMPQSPDAAGFRPIPAWHSVRDAERVGETIGVLARRELIADERRGCRRSFARGWGGMPVSAIHHLRTLLCPGRGHAGGPTSWGAGRRRLHRAQTADRPPDPGLERRPGAPARRSHRRVQRRHLPPSKEAPLNPHEGGRATPGWSGRSIPVPGITPLGSR